MGKVTTGQADLSLSVMLTGGAQEGWLPVIDLLFRRGHKVLTSSNGRAAGQLATTHRFDLVVMDVGPPRGFRNLDDFFEEPPSTYDPLIIAVIEAADRRFVQKILDRGVSGILTKPIDLTELDSWLDRAAADVIKHYASRQVDKDCILDTADLLQRTGGNLNALKMMADAFRKEIRRLIKGRHDLARKPLPEIRSSAHAVAGMAATLGLRRLTHKSREIELLAGREMKKQALTGLDELPSIIDSSIDRLNDFIAEQEDIQRNDRGDIPD